MGVLKKAGGILGSRGDSVCLVIFWSGRGVLKIDHYIQIALPWSAAMGYVANLLLEFYFIESFRVYTRTILDPR